MTAQTNLFIALVVLLMMPARHATADQAIESRTTNGISTHSIDDLAWMAGCWAATDEAGKTTEECWMAPAGGLMLGAHRESRPGKPAWFEHLRIQQGTGEGVPEPVVYWASPGGAAATAFELASVEGQRAIFENAAHDFPQRIIYHRVGETLEVRAEGEGGGAARALEWSWKRVPFPGGT